MICTAYRSKTRRLQKEIYSRINIARAKPRSEDILEAINVPAALAVVVCVGVSVAVALSVPLVGFAEGFSVLPLTHKDVLLLNAILATVFH